MGRRRGQGQAGAGPAELERGPGACARCLGSDLRVCFLPGVCQDPGGEGAAAVPDWIIRRTFYFLPFFFFLFLGGWWW